MTVRVAREGRPRGPFGRGRQPARCARWVVAALLAGGAFAPASGQDAEAGRAKAALCVACHGPNGNSTTPDVPVLAGQSARYLFLELRDYKEGRRSSAIMQAMAQLLSREDMIDIGAFFAAQGQTDTGFRPDPVKAARGQAKAAETLCTMCHLGEFRGQNEVPRVAGQQRDYIVRQLLDFRAGRRTNDAGTMSSVSKTLSEQDVDDVANYVAGLY